MDTKRFAYYDDWEGAILECPRCHWRGTFKQGSVEYYKELMDCSCPVCRGDRPMLAIVSYPTIEESEQNWSRLSDDEKRSLIERRQFIDQWERARLKTPDQLPELDGAKLKIVWGYLAEGSCQLTVLTHGGIEIWREPALWQGLNRFREVVPILEQKYGGRLADVVPTSTAEVYLYGDILDGPRYVNEIRKSLRKKHRSHAADRPLHPTGRGPGQPRRPAERE